MAKETPIEPKAKDLLPPDSPPVDESPKKIAERRVVGWMMSDRLITRAERRPVGNSRRFWKKIEEDDPFIPRRIPRRMREDHTLYPADRIDRIPADQAPPPPRAPAAPSGAPQPKKVAQPAVNRDPRAAKPPEHMRPEPPPPPPEAEGEEVQGRMMPPIFAPPTGKTRSGRIKVSSAKSAPTPSTGIVRPSADEVRAEKEAIRKAAEPAPPPKLRSLDHVLGLLGQLKRQEEMHQQGLDPTPIFDDEPAAAPKPKRVAKPTREAAPPSASPAPRPAPRPEPKPAPAEPPVDRTPPKPKAADKPKDPVTRPASAGGLNDLFGGPSEGRVKIGKRAKPSGPTEVKNDE